MSLHKNSGGLRDAVRRQPPRPLLAHPSPAGPTEGGRSRPGGSGLLQALQVRPHQLRRPQQRARLRQGLLLQPEQAGQPAVLHGAVPPAGRGFGGHGERSEPRHREDQAREAHPHPPTGQAPVLPGRAGLLQECVAGGSDPAVPGLLPAGGGRVRKVLCRLRRGHAAG